LGLMVEIVADPLWLTGIAGLTKLGKAAKLSNSAIKAAKATGKLAEIKRILKAAKAGKEIKDGGKLWKAFRTVYKAGGTPKLARTWAEQAAKGQRALLKFAGKPLIKGEKFLGAAEKLGTAAKLSKTGKLFYHPTKRVSPEFKGLHDIYTHFGRDLPQVRQNAYFAKIKELFDKGAKAGISVEDMDKTVRKYVQRAYAREGGERFIEATIAKRTAIAAQKTKKLIPKWEIAQEKLTRKKAGFREAGKLPTREQPSLLRVPKPGEVGTVPEIKGFGVKKPQVKMLKPKQLVHPDDIATRDWLGIRGQAEKLMKSPTGRKVAQAYEGRLATLRNKLNKLKATGSVADKKAILKLEHKIKQIETKAYIDWIKGKNRLELAKYTKTITADKAKVSRLQSVLKSDIKNIEKDVRNIERQLTHQQLFGKGLKKTKEGIFPVTKIQKVKSAIAKRESQAVELLKTRPVREQKFIKGIGKRYKDINKEFIEKEIAAGVPAKQISRTIGYTSNKITDDFAKFLEDNRHRPVISSLSKDLSAKNVSQGMRNKITGAMTDEEALDYYRKLGFKGESVFESGMAVPTFQRAVMSTKSAGAADTITEAIKIFSKPQGIKMGGVDDYWRSKGYTSLTDDVLKSAGMDVKSPKVAALKGQLLSNDVANALSEMHNLSTNEDALRGFWNAWTGTVRYMKGAVTMPWPAYHGRNAFSNFILNWIGGVKNPKSYAQALAMQTGKGQPIRLATGAILTPDDILRLADEWGIMGRSAGMFGTEEIGGKALIGAKGAIKRHFKGQGAIRQGGQKLGTAIEDNARLAHFIDKLKKGFNFNDAAVSAKNVLFDYGDLSHFEKKFLRDRGVFFYTFMRKNIALQTKTLLQQPGKQAIWSHIMGGTPEIAGGDQNFPDWWREQIVTRPFQIPGINLKEGQELRIAGMGAPIEEAFGSFAGPGSGFVNRARRIAARQFSRLAPPVTAATEFVTGKDIFYDRPISELGYAPTGLGEATKIPKVGGLIKKAFGVEGIKRDGKTTRYVMPPNLSWVIRKSPLSRAWSSAGMLTRDKEPLAVRASQFITGIKPRIIEPEFQKKMAERDARKKLLEEEYRRGKVRKFQRFYVPKGQEKDKEMDLLLKSQ